ncbi:thiamine pyrophosphate-dependent enzyme [Amycolatopsis arida]|uniref:thiamine pyrophosphate-dependent enzyme n=1 Tax=Amycolatopsis arida TaxID=587909 RepID=UPI001416EE54|nr:thiamine pyrophosphate-dependent enzyme [Amycolatopsis arida]
MNKTDAIRAILAATTDEPTVFTTGYASRIACGLDDRPNHFYMTGSMGLASSIGMGIAQQTGRRTVVVDGDGSLLMNPVGLMTAGALDLLPMIHVVLDDGSYASTGGQSVPSGRADLCALAEACGYQRIHDVDGFDELRALVSAEVVSCASPVFIRCALRGPEAPIPARVAADLGDHAQRFAATLQCG